MTRRMVLVLVGIAAFLAVVVLGAVFLIPAERIGALAVAHAEEALDREVRIDDFRIRLFPRPAVALEGVTISRDARPTASAPGAESGAAVHVASSGTAQEQDDPGTARGPRAGRLLASVDRIDLRPRLLPLLRGNVIVDEIVLERPRVFLEIDEGGTLNLPTMEGSGEPATGDAEIRIRRLLLRDGSVVHTDANTGAAVTLTGINQQLRLRGSIVEGELSLLALRGELSIDAIDAVMPEHFAFPIRNVRLAIEHDAELNQTEDRLDLGRLRLTVQEVPLDVEGVIHALSDPETRELSLRAGAENVDIARFVASLPPELLDGLPRGSDGEPIRGTGGRASLAVSISGRAGGEAVPDVDGTLRLDDVALSYGPYAPSGSAGNVVGGLDGVIAFTLETVATEELTGRLLGEPFRLAFDVRDLAEPQGRAEVTGGLDLGEAQRLGLLPEGMRGSGMIAVDLTATGAALQPADARVDGVASLAGVELQLPDLLRPVQLADGQVRFNGLEVAADGLRATMGRSDVALDFRAADWIALALGEEGREPTVSFDVRSSAFDADELLGYDPDKATYGELLFAHLANRPLDEHGGRTAPQIAEELGLSVPEIPDARMDGRIRAHSVVSGALTYEDVDVTLLARNGDLDVRPATFRMMGGRVHVMARLGAGESGGAEAGAGPADEDSSPIARRVTRPLTVEYAVNDVTADPFLERFTAFRGHVGGTMLLAGYARMELEENMLPERESVGSEGTVAFIDGQLENWPLVRELGNRISAAAFETLNFRDWSGRFRVAGARVILEESMLEAGELGVRAAGSFDVAGNLNLAATLYLPQELAANIPGAPAGLLAAATGEDGRVPVGARIGGTATRPSIALDLTQLGTAAASAAREAAEAEAREQAARLGVELPVPDSLGAAADSARQRIEEGVQNRLRRLIPPRGGGL